MTPEQEKALDEWLEGIRGHREPGAESGYDELDRRIQDRYRQLHQQLEAEVSEMDVARAWSISKAAASAAKQRSAVVPFSSGLAAGIAVALIGTFTVFKAGMVEQTQGRSDALITKGTDGSERPAWSAAIVSSEPRLRVRELTELLQDSHLTYVVSANASQWTVEWSYGSDAKRATIDAWLRTQGVSAPADSERVLLTVNLRSTAP